MLQILQIRLQQYVNWELPDVQVSFRKGRGTRNQIANIHWIIEKARESQKNIYLCIVDYSEDYAWITTNWKILQEMRIADHLTCLLRNLYASQEATVGTRHGTTDWFQIGKGVRQGYILSPCLFNLYADWVKHKMESRLLRKNINNLKCADDTTLMAEREEELKSLLKNVKKESKKAGLKLNIQKARIMESGPITSCK